MINIDELLQILPIDRIAMSPQIDQFCIAFNAAQKEMGLIKKSDQGHRHKYANIDTVLESVLPILGKYGIEFYQAPISIESGERLQTLLTHVSGQYISFGSIKIIHNPEDVQSLGGGITYTRRYAVVSVLGLGQEDDDGASQKESYEKSKKEYITPNQKAPVKEPKEYISTPQIESLQDLISVKCNTEEEIGELLSKIYTATKVKSLGELSSKQYYFVMNTYLKES